MISSIPQCIDAVLEAREKHLRIETNRCTRLSVFSACTQPPIETGRTACVTSSKIRLKYLVLEELRLVMIGGVIQYIPFSTAASSRLGIPVDIH